jgi:hypothetical protein
MGFCVQQIVQSIILNSAKGSISSNFVCLSNFVCPSSMVHLADEDFVANLVVIPLDVCDAVLGMDWLSPSCVSKLISLHAPSRRNVIFVGIAMKYSLSLLYHLFPYC